MGQFTIRHRKVTTSCVLIWIGFRTADQSWSDLLSFTRSFHSFNSCILSFLDLIRFVTQCVCGSMNMYEVDTTCLATEQLIMKIVCWKHFLRRHLCLKNRAFLVFPLYTQPPSDLILSKWSCWWESAAFARSSLFIVPVNQWGWTVCSINLVVTRSQV